MQMKHKRKKPHNEDSFKVPIQALYIIWVRAVFTLKIPSPFCVHSETQCVAHSASPGFFESGFWFNYEQSYKYQADFFELKCHSSEKFNLRTV